MELPKVKRGLRVIKKWVFLDMDETMVSATTDFQSTFYAKQDEASFMKSDFECECFLKKYEDNFKIRVILRPGLAAFLEALAERYNVGVFTAGI